jgi:hypothetical protein
MGIAVSVSEHGVMREQGEEKENGPAYNVML